MGKLVDLTGQKFASLTVVERAENYVSPKGAISVQWKCKCDCGNETIVTNGGLRSGNKKSCGCRIYRKKFNDYEICGEFVRVFYRDQAFIIDKEDLPLINDSKWYINKNGYVVRTKDNKTLHRLLMNPGKNELVDHINGDKTDNRRNNLRLADYSVNGYNKKLKRDTNSGEYFINQNRTTGYYSVYIDGKYIGGSKALEEAIRIRDTNLDNSKVATYNRELQSVIRKS